jgi:cyclohexadieny/prephenate dehydrogenase
MSTTLPSLGIIGLGMIGASVALAARRHDVADEIIGFDSSEDTVRLCQQEEIVDSIMPLEAMAARCSLIIIAVPPHIVAEVTQKLLPHLGEDTVITDVASTKLPILQMLEQMDQSDIPFIPGHPIAGNTHTGPSAADANIFSRKLVMLTPPQGIDIEDPALQRVTAFWEALDTTIEMMPADFHDLVYGYVSHLPHMIAFAASAAISLDYKSDETREKLQRFLRLGNSDPALWSDIFFHNLQPVLQALQTYTAMLAHIKQELENGPAEGEGNKADETSETPKADDHTAVHTLFPRIASSCLVATVTMLERQSGQRLARYSGAGFADVASPAAEAPEGDMELISHHTAVVLPLITAFEAQLQQLLAALQAGQAKQMLSLLTEMQEKHRTLMRD